MGSCCGKESKADSGNFVGPGRTLGSAPPPSNTARAPIPTKVTRNAESRAVGGAEGPNDPRAAAARAAEERAKKGQGTGALGKQLDAQKRQTQAELLAQASNDNRRAREADQNATLRDWN